MEKKSKQWWRANWHGKSHKIHLKIGKKRKDWRKYTKCKTWIHKKVIHEYMETIIHYPHYSINQARAIRVKKEKKKKGNKERKGERKKARIDKKITWSREVRLQVELLGGSVIEFAWHNVDHTVGQAQGLAEVLRIADHLLHHGPWSSIMGWCQAELFHLRGSNRGIFCHPWIILAWGLGFAS